MHPPGDEPCGGDLWRDALTTPREPAVAAHLAQFNCSGSVAECSQQKWFERGSIPTIPFIYLLIQSRAGLRDVLNEYWEFD